MVDAAGVFLYVGKAKNLKKRVSSYFSGIKTNKVAQLLATTVDIQITVTNSELEAYLLENKLIEEHKPKYNVIFRDDKSYPYILITNEEFPQLKMYRGKHEPEQGSFFGPYPSANKVKELLDFLYKTFRLRQCEKSFFANRSRPCLQYQLNKCTAPCVGLIDEADYMTDLQHAKMCLAGKSESVIISLADKMQELAEVRQYEAAAKLRDQIKLLRQMQQQQVIVTSNQLNIDIIALVKENSWVCIHLLEVRQGNIIASRQFFNKGKLLETEEPTDIFTKFILRYYANQSNRTDLPDEIVINYDLNTLDIILEYLVNLFGKSPRIVTKRAGPRGIWLDMAQNSACNSLVGKINKNEKKYAFSFNELASACYLPYDIKTIECFDISHTQGEATTGACVVYNCNGASYDDYRRYHLSEVASCDDYAAIKAVVTKHYKSYITSNKQLPSLIVIDGGKGQLKQAEIALAELGLDYIQLLSIAKGKMRKSGLEKLYLGSSAIEIKLNFKDKAFLLLQEIRDEAHRFAITGHRRQRAKSRTTSTLESVAGIGKARRKKLLTQFGGLQGLKEATITDLSKIPGISKILAQRIYDALHGNNEK